jgi:large subunit ribosomal protein L30e
MNIEISLKKILATGKVSMGIKEAIKSKKKGEVKLFIVANDCPQKNEISEIAKDVPIYNFNGNSINLGLACGKPFGISILSVIDEGKSEILEQI